MTQTSTLTATQSLSNKIEAIFESPEFIEMITKTVIVHSNSGIIQLVTETKDPITALVELQKTAGFDAAGFEQCQMFESEFSIYTSTKPDANIVEDGLENEAPFIGYYKIADAAEATGGRSTVQLLSAALSSAEAEGFDVCYDGNADGKFAIDLSTGDKIDFHGFSGAPTFTVELADGYKTDVQYDFSQMEGFESYAALQLYIAEHPVEECRDAVVIAERRRDEAAIAADPASRTFETDDGETITLTVLADTVSRSNAGSDAELAWIVEFDVKVTIEGVDGEFTVHFCEWIDEAGEFCDASESNFLCHLIREWENAVPTEDPFARQALPVIEEIYSESFNTGSPIAA